MATVSFTKNLQRFVDTHESQVDGDNIAQVLDAVFTSNPTLKSYILDHQRAVRKHLGIFIDGELISDRQHLNDSVKPNSKIMVVQALSGG
jgi:molybdopterin synthase sulfur carrier subunit